MKFVFYLCLILVVCKGNKMNKKANVLIDDIVKSMSLKQKIG